MRYRCIKGTTGHTTDFPRQIFRADEVSFLISKRIPLSTNLLDTCRTGLWLIPCHVVLPCIQNGRSPVPCIQRCHRHTRALRHCRSLNRIFVGKYVKGRHTQFQLYRLRNDSACMGLALFCGNNYAGIITGVILIDIGMQCIQLSNQTSIFDIYPSASNRVNTIFMTTYFIGGSLGTFLAGSSWQTWGWSGVVGTGVILTIISLSITLYSKK